MARIAALPILAPACGDQVSRRPACRNIQEMNLTVAERCSARCNVARKIPIQSHDVAPGTLDACNRWAASRLSVGPA
jgi:hypothetical protein